MAERIKQEVIEAFFKIFLPAIVAVSVKIAIEMNKRKMTVQRAILSMVWGIGMAWLFSGVIGKLFSNEVQPIIIALIAISSEKVAEYVIYKFNIDEFLDGLFAAFKDFLINIINPKK